MIRTVAALLLAAVSAGAGMIDRVPAVEPVSSLIATHAPRVVASDIGMYLAGSQRVTAEGSLVDDEPIPGAEGYAASWHDGWLVVSPHDHRRRYVRHLRASGPPEIVMILPDEALRQRGVASAAGRLAILEVGDWPTSVLRVTVTDGDEVLQQHALGFHAWDAVIAPQRDGFIVAWWSRDGANPATLSVARLDANGVRVGYRVLETSNRVPPNPLRLAASETHAIVLWSDFSSARYRIIDSALQPTPAKLVGAGGITFEWGIDLEGSEGFFVSYRRLREHRAHIVRPDGSVVSDVPADPVSGGDRIGSRYLVTRPWGQAAIAEGDPRAIIGPAVQLDRRVFERWDHLLSVVSGDVTMIRFGRALAIDQFVRVDADGQSIDTAPRRIPAMTSQDLVTIPIPDGFAFAWPDGDAIRYQRLTRRGDWLDAQPVTLPVSTDRRRFALHANDEGLLIAWATGDEMRWMRLTHAGEPIDVVPRRMLHATSHHPWGVSISGNGTDRLLALLALLDHGVCVITCEPMEPAPFIVEVLAIDRDANPLGVPTPTESEGLRVVGLHDGSWAIASRSRSPRVPEVLHVARDGRVIAKVAMPILANDDVSDVAPTPSGWKAIVHSPSRLVEFDGATTASRVTGLATTMQTRFAANGKLAFLDGSPLLESVAIPWTGRVSAIDGDIAVTMTDLGTAGTFRSVVVTVRNNGPSDVTNVRVARALRSAAIVTVPSLRPGEAHQFLGEVQANGTVLADSTDVTDTNPSDNWSTLATASPRGDRQRPVRP